MKNIAFAIPRVVAIDNRPDELKQITEALHAIGVPCLPILYEADAWPPENFAPANGSIRLVFLDLNLLDSQSLDAKSITPHTARVLKDVVKGGPYILVFWSKHADMVDEVMTLLQQRHSDGVVAPLKWAILSKLDFQLSHDTTPAAIDANEKRKHELANKIAEVLKEPPALRALTNWETRVSASAAATLARLNDIAAEKDRWNFADTASRLSGILTWIAHETVGRQHAKNIPSDAAEQGLISALGDELSRNLRDHDYDVAWQEAMPQIGKKDFLHDPEYAAHLNQVFHIDTSGLDHRVRGTFVFISPKIEADAKSVKSLFGGIRTVRGLKSEFIDLEAIEEALRDDILSSCRLGLVELSAACDFAQRKDRSLRYVLAALIPHEHAKFSEFRDHADANKPPRSTKHEAIYRLPPIRIGDKNFVCKLNFRHILGLPDDSSVIGEAYFRIRSPLLDEIAYRCSTHLARPGIVAFHH